MFCMYLVSFKKIDGVEIFFTRVQSWVVSSGLRFKFKMSDKWGFWGACHGFQHTVVLCCCMSCVCLLQYLCVLMHLYFIFININEKDNIFSFLFFRILAIMPPKKKRKPPVQSNPGTAFCLVQQYFPEFPHPPADLLKGHVLAVHLRTNNTAIDTARHLQSNGYFAESPLDFVRSRVDQLSKNLAKLRRLKSDENEKQCFINVCNEVFDASYIAPLRSLSNEQLQATLPQENACLTLPPVKLQDNTASSSSCHTISPLKTRAVAKCQNCRNRYLALRHHLDEKEQARKKHSQEIRALKTRIRPLWALYDTISRRDARILSLKAEVKELKQQLKGMNRLSESVKTSKKKAKEEKEKRMKVERQFASKEKKLKRDLTMEYEDSLCQALDVTSCSVIEK